MIPAFRKRNEGFSLIELAILLVVIALIGGSMLQSYDVWYQAKISGDNGSRQTLISNALSLFFTEYGRLPCPADPALSANAASAGYEVCLGSFGTAPPTTMCSGKVCRVLGQRDTAADPDTSMDPVLIGSIPYAALGLTALDGVDGWGDKFTYAVSEYMTNTDTTKAPACTTCVYNDAWSAITMKALSLNPDGTEQGIFPLNPGLGKFPMVVLSHGKDGKGAYSYDGLLNVACTAGARDTENCNGDSIFLATGPGLYSTVPGPNFFDDPIVFYTIRHDSDKWMTASGGSMQNKTSGRVGINNPAPSSTLDVGGNVNLDDGWIQNYCSDVSGNCFEPSIIGGTIDDSSPAVSSAHCGTATSPEFMQGINNAQVWKTDCVNALNTLTITPTLCAAGKYATGIDATGNLICVTP